MSRLRGQPPAAPAKARVLSRTTATRTPSTNNNSLSSSDETDRLAENLGSKLLISTKKSAPITNPSARSRTTQDAVAKSVNKPSPASFKLSPLEQAKEAMKVVNKSLQSLSVINKAPWRASSEPTPPRARPASSTSTVSSKAAPAGNREMVESAAGACSTALKNLRGLVKEGKISNKATDVEKAAGSLVANLVEMELYPLALEELVLMRSSILSWYDANPAASINLPRSSAPPSILSRAFIMSFALPPSSFFDPPTLEESIASRPVRPTASEIVPLVLVVQQYASTVLFRSELSAGDNSNRPQAIWSAIEQCGNTLEWRRTLEGNINVENLEIEPVLKRVDGMMTSMFGTITKGCAGLDQVVPPQVLLNLRSYAIQLLATTRLLSSDPLKLDTLYDQTRKVFILFGRRSQELVAGETKICAGVKRAFEEILAELERKRIAPEGSSWTGLCDVVLHVAKRADDLAMMDRVLDLIDSKVSGAKSVSPDIRASQTCARMLTSLSILEVFCKTGEDNGVADQIRRILAALPVLSSLRCGPLSADSQSKIDKIVERLRFITIRKLRDGRRLDRLITDSGDNPHANSEVEDELWSLLGAMVAHREILQTHWVKSEDPDFVTSEKDLDVPGTVEALIVLAYNALAVDNRSTFTTTFNFLDRCLPLLSAVALSDSLTLSSLRHPYSLAFLASTYYNIAGTLFNASKPESSMRFVRRSCQLGESVAALVKPGMEPRRIEVTDEGTEVAKDLRKHMARRWELLALASHAVGDRKMAVEAYISAIVDQAPESISQFSNLASTIAFSTLVEREPSLVKLIHRVTKLSTFDLLLDGNAVSLGPRLAAAGFDAAAIGAILEIQLSCLQAHLDKSEAAAAIPALLGSILEIYLAEDFPVRRARTLLHQMQHLPTSSGGAYSPALGLVEEIETLCVTHSFAQDESLKSFSRQTVAFSHVWLGFHAHQNRISSSSESIADEARKALRLLREALDGELPPSPSKPLVSIAPSKAAPAPEPKTRTRKVVADKSSFKTPKTSRTLPGRTRAKAELTTPPPSKSPFLHPPIDSSPRRSDLTSSLLLEDPDRCYNTLETMANLLGALGYSLLRMSYLRLLRRLSTKHRTATHDGAFVLASARLGHEYVQLGKTARAGVVFAQAEARLNEKVSTVVPVAIQVLYLAAYAEYLAWIGNHDRSAIAYAEALEQSAKISNESGPSVANRVVERTLVLQRSATAAAVCSVLFQRKGDLNRSLAPAMQALRVWSRALSNISRLLPQDEPSSANSATPFLVASSDPRAPLPDLPVGARKRSSPPVNGPNAGLVWSLSESLATSLLRVAELHSIRGNPKSAEYYAQQAIDFATELGSARILARALNIRAEVRMHTGNTQDAFADLDLISEALAQASCRETIDAHRLRATLHLKNITTSLDLEQATHWSREAQSELERFVGAAVDNETGQSPPKDTSSGRISTMTKTLSQLHLSPSPAKATNLADGILPSVQANLLRLQVSLLRKTSGSESIEDLLGRLSKITMLDEDHAEELGLRASIQLQALQARLSKDSVLDTLSDSVLSIPHFGALVATKAASPKGDTSIYHCLREIDTLLERALALSVSRVEPSKLRELSLLTTNLRALQSSVGKANRHSASTVAVLDLGLAVTLRREMLDAIDRKLADSATQDDLAWPSIQPPLPSLSDGTSPMAGYWASLRERYATEAVDATLTEQTISSLLPTNWTVVSMHLAPDSESLLLARHRRNAEPLVFKIPLGRTAQREGEDDFFTYEFAVNELREIITASNAGAQNAKNVNGKEERAAWWAERKQLDERLEGLTQALEDTWLGAFKSVLLDTRHFTPTSLAAFKAHIELVMKRITVRSQEKKAVRFKLGDAVLDCLSALSPTARDEDIEDLFYFMMESLQFAGVPLAIDEIDADQVFCDLRTGLEDLHNANPLPSPLVDEHTFLILDKSVQSFPWESIPCLRGRSVSRLPSLAFLRDRIELAGVLAESSTPKHEIAVDSRKTSFVLNPGGDLKNTQTTFQPWLETMKKVGWNGIIGRAPSDEEMRAALSTKELFLYFGHGGAEQFVRSQTIRNLSRCAVTMLWGCSSGVLKDLGDFDPVGTPYHYMIAGCPALVANLWDVTDKDIDKFSQSVFTKLGLNEESTPSPKADSVDDDPARSTTLAEAVATSRDVCHLKFLNGAAPVVYGVPVRFSSLRP